MLASPLALIRTSEKNGFYFDVFRSRAKEEAGSFHDYVYHNVGQSLALHDAGGAKLPLESTTLSRKLSGLPGYKYFKDERSLPWTNDLHGVFALDMPDGTRRAMNVWMLGASDRTVFTLAPWSRSGCLLWCCASLYSTGRAAPGNRAGRDSMPASVNELPMPIPPGRDARVEKVRAAKISGDASALALWSKPWRTAGTGNQTYSTGRAAAVVEGKDFRICLMQDDQQVGTHTVEGNTFQGRFGVVVTREGTVSEIYLGSGQPRKLSGLACRSAL